MALFSRGFAFMLIAPYLCSVSPDSTNNDELSIALAAGGGSYAEISRSCDGRVNSVTNRPYAEVAGAVRYRSSVLELGLTGGTTTGIAKANTSQRFEFPQPTPKDGLEARSVVYVTPSMGVTSKYFGLGLGYLISLNEVPIRLPGSSREIGIPSGSIRIGNIDGTHFSAGCARNLPLIAGGGLYDLGFSSPVGGRGSRVWYGVGGFPYDGIVFSLKGDVRLAPRFVLTPTFHAKGGDAVEYGGSIGARMTY